MIRALAMLALVAPVSAQSRISWARCELQGPLSEPALELVPGSPTQLHGELLAGERVERVLPVVVDARGARGEPRWIFEPDPDHQARARFLGWVHEADERWSALSPGLRSRPRPPVQPADTTPPPALFFLLGGAALASVALARRHRFGAAGPALAGCGLVLGFARAGAAGAPQAWVVLEGQGEGAWIEVRAAWENLALPAGASPLVLESEPENAALSIATSLAAPGEIALHARAAGLTAIRVPDPAPGRIAEEGQDCADFAAVWWRAEGEWTCRGAWNRGTALPSATTGEQAPGWLMNGLPQGPRVCLARTAGEHPRWFRHLGP